MGHVVHNMRDMGNAKKILFQEPEMKMIVGRTRE
jgi:hypothetical protein